MVTNKQDIQAILDRAVNIATESAVSGKPIKRLVWCTQNNSTEDFRGFFLFEYQPSGSI